MRIRNYRWEYLPTLVQIQQQAARFDGVLVRSEEEFAAWLHDPGLDAASNVLVMTDDDDELMLWGQAGTLEGVEGEIVGYTVVQLRRDEQGYHLLSEGAVLPEHRHRHAGRALLVGAMNRARVLADEFEFEAEQEGIPVYFEALLPHRDPASGALAAKYEMYPTEERAPAGMQLYRREL
jgi:ribosomal protein S18 acetylase RimI-like enzyme